MFLTTSWNRQTCQLTELSLFIFCVLSKCYNAHRITIFHIRILEDLKIRKVNEIRGTGEGFINFI